MTDSEKAAVNRYLGEIERAVRGARESLGTTPFALTPPLAQGSALPASVDDLDPATANELDSEYGDPEIKYPPKKWIGPDYAGCNYSRTEPKFLRQVASYELWRAKKLESEGATTKAGKPTSAYAIKNARLALGWAARLEAAAGASARTQHRTRTVTEFLAGEHDADGFEGGAL